MEHCDGNKQANDKIVPKTVRFNVFDLTSNYISLSLALLLIVGVVKRVTLQR